MARHPLETAGLAVIMLMVIGCIVGFIMIQSGSLATYPWTITFGGLGIMAAVGGLVFGFARSARS